MIVTTVRKEKKSGKLNAIYYIKGSMWTIFIFFFYSIALRTISCWSLCMPYRSRTIFTVILQTCQCCSYIHILCWIFTSRNNLMVIFTSWNNLMVIFTSWNNLMVILTSWTNIMVIFTSWNSLTVIFTSWNNLTVMFTSWNNLMVMFTS